MTFLQPWMLFALPLIALPVIIHLINQRRFRTIRWGAMMFLLTANRMSRGYARIRQWLILAARTLAVAGLLLAVSRPLASGWMSLVAGGKADTTMILLDRSPSMLEQGSGGRSKLDSAREQLVSSLSLLGSNRWILFESADVAPIEIESPEALNMLMQTAGVSASADIPAMLQAAYDYVRENRPSRTEIWMVSDVRRNDWDPGSGRWQAIRDAFLELPHPVRFHLLAYPDPAQDNRAVRVTDVRRVETSAGAELLVSLTVEQTRPEREDDDRSTGSASSTTGPVVVPVQLEIDGARSEISVELVGGQAELKDYAIPLDREQTRGWGRVSIPADANPADNEFYFVYDRPAARRTILVAEDADAVRALELAAAIAPHPSIDSRVEILTPEQVGGSGSSLSEETEEAVDATDDELPLAHGGTGEFDDVSLLLWQAQLPQGELADRVRRFLRRGGEIIFFPPPAPDGSEFGGIRWEGWREEQPGLDAREGGVIPVSSWVGDQDLLARARSGIALPVGDLKVTRYCEISGEQTALATLADGAPLLCRAVVDAGGQEAGGAGGRDLRSPQDPPPALERQVYFCTTSTSAADSSLARDGVVLYVMIQRALAAGAESLAGTAQFVAGRAPAASSALWQRLSEEKGALPTTYGVQAGVYEHEGRLFSINRSEQEDRAAIVPDAQVAGLFEQLDFQRIDEVAGSGSSLLSEIWRAFLALMMAALLVEAGLCLPKTVNRAATAPAAPPASGRRAA